jgi:hypothetical protein
LGECFGVEVSLKPGVLLLQFGDFLLVPGEPFLALVAFAPEPLIFSFQALDVFPEPLEKSGTTTATSSVGLARPK